MKNLLLTLFIFLACLGYSQNPCTAPNVDVSQIGVSKFKITTSPAPGTLSTGQASALANYRYKYLIDGVTAKDTSSASPSFKISLANTGTSHQISVQKSCGSGGGVSSVIIRDLEIATVVDVSSFDTNDPIDLYVLGIYGACGFQEEFLWLSDEESWINRSCFCDYFEALNYDELLTGLNDFDLLNSCGPDGFLWDQSLTGCRGAKGKSLNPAFTEDDSWMPSVLNRGVSFTINDMNYSELSFYSITGQLIASIPLDDGSGLLPNSVSTGMYIVAASNTATGELFKQKIIIR